MVCNKNQRLAYKNILNRFFSILNSANTKQKTLLSDSNCSITTFWSTLLVNNPQSFIPVIHQTQSSDLWFQEILNPFLDLHSCKAIPCNAGSSNWPWSMLLNSIKLKLKQFNRKKKACSGEINTISTQTISKLSEEMNNYTLIKQN